MSSMSANSVEWLRSSYSVGMNNCVETALLGPDRLGVRDSKNTAGPVLLFTPSSWASFLEGLKDDGPGSGTSRPAGD
ncbi:MULTISPECIES: DUF397 domain-containing protein [Streptomyces]|uniref:DUF397 domain-containing protein n=3 Tax=Streptomyces TaxID=1883 RepID=A0ABT9L330_9ACTN|nr:MULTISPECIES: DUF397 domain-containing protein [Streptomyces]MBW8093269.1 DUF397 domain-containing protein [Streptomyces hygroscopicus subsp. hygroscopicus]MCO8306441.1 DUF397 domain-containing protein [Streptomyces sp. RKCA744]MDN3055021.1 DUF397 domain-containing protein [Streptomyces sp. SRF1]MDP9615116.1 hypothetical protein [Streptomyces demainii]GHJ33017.1 hypothetical protein TPA0910_74500 [Streptomyces hygroscopicus]